MAMNDRITENSWRIGKAFAGPVVYCAGALVFSVIWEPPPVTAHDLKNKFAIAAPSPEEIATANAESVLYDLDGRFTRAFEDRLVGKNFVLAIFLNDYSSGNIIRGEADPWLAEEVEAQAKLLARQAIYQALAETVNDVQVLYRMKEYGTNLTTAEVAVKNGELDFDGPSIEDRSDSASNNGRIESPASFSSRLKLDAGIDLGLSWRTTFDRFEYRLTYFLVSEDFLGMSLHTKITDRTSIGMTYRVGPNERRTIATLSIALP
jgi:hypothetical protein